MDPALMPSESSSTSSLSYALDADKDIVEIDLDDGAPLQRGLQQQPSCSTSSKLPSADTSRRSSHRESMKSPLYPAMLLDGASASSSSSSQASAGLVDVQQQQPYLSLPSSQTQQQQKTPSAFVTSAPELPRWDDDTTLDYFYTANTPVDRQGNVYQNENQTLFQKY
jgi:hypothetical protein